METAWISNVAKRLDDPLMMDWALWFYDDHLFDASLTQELQSSWFSDGVIKHWLLESDMRVATLMLRKLPASCFYECKTILTSQWLEWTSLAAKYSAKILADIAPAEAADIFIQYMRKEESWKFERLVGILGGINKMSAEIATPIIEELWRLAPQKGKKHLSFITKALLKPTIRIVPQDIERLAVILDEYFLSPRKESFASMVDVSEIFFGHNSYADIYELELNGYEAPSVEEIAPLLEEDAPLEDLQAIIKGESPFELAIQLLEKCHLRTPASGLAWQTLQRTQAYQNRKYLQTQAVFAFAASAAAFERKSLDLSHSSLQDFVNLLALEVKTNIHSQQIIEKLRSFPRVQLVDELVRALPPIADLYGGLQLVRLMGELGWGEFVPSLIDCIGESRGDYSCETARQSLLSIGKDSRDALMAQWDSLDSTQKIYGGSVIRHIGGPEVADFVLNHLEELSEEMENWHNFTISYPDARLLEQVSKEIHRQQYFIDMSYYYQCSFLDVNSPDLNDVRGRILPEYERQTKWMVSDDDLELDFLNTQRGFLQLSLLCSSCNAVNEYKVKHVAVDSSKMKEPLLADEFTCSSCGVLGDFVFTNHALTAVSMEMVMANLSWRNEEDYLGPLMINHKAASLDGSAQSLVSAYHNLKEKVQSDPEDWLSWFRLGNVLLYIYRPQMALVCFEKVTTLKPFLIEGVISYAQGLESTNEKVAAFDYLHSALENHEHWKSVTSRLTEKKLDFMRLHNRLRRELMRNDLIDIDVSFFKREAKPGRNDRCPCGSGKKYKKCCMTH